jgi:hypothetical protein
MKPVSIADMIGSRLGKEMQSDYLRLLDKDRRAILRHGLKVGRSLGKSVTGNELPEYYVDEGYKRWLLRQKK